MNRYLLDANHASPLVTLHHPLRDRVAAAQSVGDTFGLIAPVITEVVFGFLVLPRSNRNLHEWDRLRLGFSVYVVDEDVALEAAVLQAALRRRGWQLTTVDALSAVVAVQDGLILLTTDADFAAVPGLRTENWLQR